MTREQLETIANEHNVKNIKKLDDENLAYAILDAEAKEESVKLAPEKPRARRGRPPKQKTAEAAQTEVPAQKDSAETAAPEPKPAPWPLSQKAFGQHGKDDRWAGAGK